jgi:hypothetical protein
MPMARRPRFTGWRNRDVQPNYEAPLSGSLREFILLNVVYFAVVGVEIDLTVGVIRGIILEPWTPADLSGIAVYAIWSGAAAHQEPQAEQLAMIR